MRDSEWIATLLRAGLLNGSFIPYKNIREFRHLNRYRKSIVCDITSQKNRVEKFLQSSGFRLSSFISDIFGASGRNIISYLIEHRTISKEALDSCLKTKTRNHMNEILIAVNGTLSKHQQDFLKMLMDHYDSLKVHLTEIEAAVEVEMDPSSHCFKQWHKPLYLLCFHDLLKTLIVKVQVCCEVFIFVARCIGKSMCEV